MWLNSIRTRLLKRKPFSRLHLVSLATDFISILTFWTRRILKPPKIDKDFLADYCLQDRRQFFRRVNFGDSNLPAGGGSPWGYSTHTKLHVRSRWARFKSAEAIHFISPDDVKRAGCYYQVVDTRVPGYQVTPLKAR